MNDKIKELFEIFKRNEFSDAKKLALKLEKKYKKNVVIYKILGTIESQAGNYLDALKYFEKALDLDPSSYENLNNVGNALDDNGNYKEAIHYFKEALKIKPKNIHVMNNLGNALNSFGKPEEAVGYYKKALKINPKFYQTYNNLGNALKKIGLLSDAIKSYQKSISIQSDYSKAHNNLGVAYMENADLADSFKSYKRALEINPKNVDALWNIHPFSSNIDEALRILNMCAKLDRHHIKAKLTIIALEFYRGNQQFYNQIKESSLKDHPYVRSFNWVFSLKNLPRLFFDRWSFYDSMINMSDKYRPFYEFGVWRGKSFSYLIDKYKFGYGFDTFIGIPEDWYNEPKGSYTSDGYIPDIDGGEFIKGDFKETLPDFFSIDRPLASLINFDADLYSSTICALKNSKNIIDEKTILIFDEFILNDDWENDEYKALIEFCSENSLIYEVLGLSFYTKQVALRLKRLEKK